MSPSATTSSRRTSVGRSLRGRPAGEVALEQHAAKPEQWDKALEAELVEVDAGSDALTVEAAQRLMALLDAPGTRSGRYVVDARGAHGVQFGDGNIMYNRFER